MKNFCLPQNRIATSKNNICDVITNGEATFSRNSKGSVQQVQDCRTDVGPNSNDYALLSLTCNWYIFDHISHKHNMFVRCICWLPLPPRCNVFVKNMQLYLPTVTPIPRATFLICRTDTIIH